MFKNAIVFSLPESVAIDEDFMNSIQDAALKEPTDFEAESKGWVSPFNNDMFVLSQGNKHLFKFGISSKIIPPKTIKRELDKRVASIEEQHGTKVGRQAMNDLKHQIHMEYLPTALVKDDFIYCFIDNDINAFFVDTPSQNKAEMVCSFLRQNLGSFKATASGPSVAVAQTLSQWLIGNAPESIEITDEATLNSFDETKASIKAKHIDTMQDTLSDHIDNGFLVSDVGLCFSNRIDFTLTNSLAIKKIKLTDVTRDELHDIECEDSNDQMAALFSIMAGELSLLKSNLLNQFQTD